MTLNHFVISPNGKNHFRILWELSMVVHFFNPSTQEFEAGTCQVQDQPGLHSKILSQKPRREKERTLWGLNDLTVQLPNTFLGFATSIIVFENLSVLRSPFQVQSNHSWWGFISGVGLWTQGQPVPPSPHSCLTCPLLQGKAQLSYRGNTGLPQSGLCWLVSGFCLLHKEVIWCPGITAYWLKVWILESDCLGPTFVKQEEWHCHCPRVGLRTQCPLLLTLAGRFPEPMDAKSHCRHSYNLTVTIWKGPVQGRLVPA
jgi:hypothetical protein